MLSPNQHSTKPTESLFSFFSAGQLHAEKLTAAFNSYEGVNAECVIDKTDPDKRAQIIERYKNGVTQVLVNCMVFTEGFDAPKTAVIANTRMTKSISLYLQIIGRGTRPLKGVVDGPETAEERRAGIAASGKPFCVVLDFVGNSGNHKLATVFDVLAGKDVDPLDVEEAMKVAESEDKEVDVEELIEKVKKAREERERIAEEERQKRMTTKHYASSATYTATGRKFVSWCQIQRRPTLHSKARWPKCRSSQDANESWGYS